MFTRPTRPIERVFIHCSASDHPDHDSVKVIDEWHRERGWNGVGYHYVIVKSGDIEVGRPLEVTPAAQRGNNSGTIAICVTGLHHFSAQQAHSLLELCMDIDDAYKEIIAPVTFHGHCEVANKLCPVFDYKQVLRLDADGYMLNTQPSILLET